MQSININAFVQRTAERDDEETGKRYVAADEWCQKKEVELFLKAKQGREDEPKLLQMAADQARLFDDRGKKLDAIFSEFKAEIDLWEDFNQ